MERRAPVRSGHPHLSVESLVGEHRRRRWVAWCRSSSGLHKLPRTFGSGLLWRPLGAQVLGVVVLRERGSDPFASLCAGPVHARAKPVLAPVLRAADRSLDPRALVSSIPGTAVGVPVTKQ